MKRFAPTLLVLAALAGFAGAAEPGPLARFGSEGNADRPDSLRAVAASPDGRFVAIAGEPETPTGGYSAQIREVETGRLVHRLGGHEGPVRSVAFSPKNDLLATATSDADGIGQVRLFEVATGKLSRSMDAGGRLVRFQPDGRLLVAGYGHVVLFDAATGREVGRFAAMPVVKDVTPDGRRALGVSQYGQPLLEVRDLTAGRAVARLTGCVAEPTAAVLSPDGRTVAAADPRTRTVLVWEVLTGQVVHRLPADTTVMALAFTADGRRLLAGGTDRAIRGWEVATGGETGRLAGHEGAVMALAATRDGRLLSGGTDRVTLLWPAEAINGSSLPTGPFAGADFDRLWDSLAGTDAGAAYRSLGLIAARPGETWPEVTRRVERQLVPVPDADLARLIADLDAPNYLVREEATAALTKAGEAVRPQLEQALAAAASPEARSRLRVLLRRSGIAPRFSPGDLLRLRRLTGEAESQRGDAPERLLRLVAEQLPEAGVAAEARESLRRAAAR